MPPSNQNDLANEKGGTMIDDAASEPQRSGADGSGTGASAAGEAASAADDAASLRRERDDLKDQLLRSRAEFANYQKRARQQADADRIYAIGDLARDLLEAVDNLERAAEALRSTASEGISSGVEMVQKQILGILAKHGVEPIEALGQPFDPNLHEALTQTPSSEHPEGTVVAVLGRGYKIHDRVLRPSKVAVSVKPQE